MNLPRLLSTWFALSLLAGCGAPKPPAAGESATAPAIASPVALTPELQKVYDGSCHGCHGVPASGAPQAGDPKAWAPRLAQGKEVLLGHVLNGYQRMPPMGLCMQCTEEQFVALTEYMAGRPLP